jgi:hypothetical protein
MITRQKFDCLAFPDAEPDISHPPTGVVVMITKICSFRSSLADHLAYTKSSRPCKDTLLLLMRQAMRTQQDFETWADSLPLEWRPASILDSDGRSLVTYSTQWLGVILTMYHASLIIFYHSVLRCCQLVLDSLSAEMTVERELAERSAAMAEKNLTHLISVVCDSLPFTLGEIDNIGNPLTTPTYKGSVCHTLIWPLVLVTICPNSTEDQARVCKETLARINHIYGIDLAHSAQKWGSQVLVQVPISFMSTIY